MFNAIVLAKNLIASIDASETKALPNDFFLNSGFIFPSSLISQGYRATDLTAWHISTCLLSHQYPDNSFWLLELLT